MGQYYKFVNIDKKEICDRNRHGYKLMEHSYVSNDYCNDILRLLSNEWKGDRVIHVGDYAESTDSSNTAIIIEKLSKELKIFLDKNGYDSVILQKFDNAVEDILEENADLILLDINLPYTDGEYICKEIRKTSDVPIIMVTSRDNEMDELISLNYGADQYVTKPFNIQILLAKIAGLIKRNQNADKSQEKIKCNEFILNVSKSVIETENKKIELTKNELKILHYLVLNQRKIVSREEIMNYLWESENFIDDNTLTVNMTRLRGKLEELGIKDSIETKRGQGYILK